MFPWFWAVMWRGWKVGAKAKKNRDIATVCHENCSLSSVDVPTLLCEVKTRSACNKTDIVIDHLIDFDIDIMCLTETWLTDTERHRKTIGDLTPPGFDLVHVRRSFRSGGELL